MPLLQRPRCRWYTAKGTSLQRNIYMYVHLPVLQMHLKRWVLARLLTNVLLQHEWLQYAATFQLCNLYDKHFMFKHAQVFQ